MKIKSALMKNMNPIWYHTGGPNGIYGRVFCPVRSHVNDVFDMSLIRRRRSSVHDSVTLFIYDPIIGRLKSDINKPK